MTTDEQANANIMQALNQTDYDNDSGPALEYKSRNQMNKSNVNNTTYGSNTVGSKKGTTTRKMKNGGLGAFANPTKSWNNKSMFLKWD